MVQIQIKKYYPYKSDKPTKKFYIITKDNKKVYFGAAGMSDFTINKDPVKKLKYIMRHQNENWNDFNTAGAWSRFLLWEEPNIKDAYKKIKNKLLQKGLITLDQYNYYVL